MMLDVKTDIRSIERDLRRIEPLVTKSTVRALNRTIKHVQSQSVKAISSHTQVQQKAIRTKTSISKSNPRKLTAVLRMKLLPIKAIKLNASQTKKGMSIPKHQFPSAFIATMSSGKQGVFQRRGKRRLPIREVMIAINPPAESLIKQAMNKSRAFFKKQLESDLKWRLHR